MDLFHKEHLKELAQAHQPVSVSLFMPTNHVESEFAQNPIRLKNLIREGRHRLKEEGCSDQDIEATFAPVQALLDHERYWYSMSHGLAAFLTPSAAEFYRLPLRFEELVVTGRRFHIKPLFPLFASNNQFFLLTLAQHSVRLYQGTHYTISEVQETEIPKDIVEAVLQFEEYERSLQFHTAAKMSDGRHDHIVHGQGVQDEDVQSPHSLLRRFFQEIDAGVRKTLHDETAPLVLAGVEYYLPIYRAVNSYQHLIDDDIVSGNPEHVNPKALHARAWEIIEPLFLQAQQESLAQFQELFNKDGGLASDDLKEIVPAAAFSRIDTLFVRIGQQQWGRYDMENNVLELHEERQAGDEDLLDFATVHTYLKGGTVHALKPDNMPVDAPLAAIFRYAADVAAAEEEVKEAGS